MTTDDIEVSALTADELRFRDPAGRLRTWRVYYGAGPTAHESGVHSRRVTTEDGITAVCRWVPAELVTRSPAACAALENEVRSGVRLAHRYGGRYPAEVTRLLGYDLDCAEPFLLLAPVRGRPADEIGQLLLDDRHAFQVSLLRAVLLLGEAGIVHGNLNGRTVRWDGYSVQVSGFAQAAAVGDERLPRSDLTDAPAAIREGTGRASTADDVWAAGKVILWMADRDDSSDDLTHRGAALRTLLDGVFAEDVRARPAAADLLRRLGADATAPPADPASTRAFEDGAREFDLTLARKWPPPEPAPPPVPAKRRGRRIDYRGDAFALTLVVTIGVIFVLVMIFWRPW